jgi:NitT/TauT family transport system permease protein
MNDRVKAVLYPAITGIIIIAIWMFATRIMGVANYILPDISQVGVGLYRGYIVGDLWVHFAFTLQSVVLGYIAGLVLAIGLGILVAEFKAVERAVFPYVIALQSMPKIALAPLIIVWFGFGIESKIVLVALICFFPLFINTVMGIRSVDPDLIDLMRVFGRSRFDMLLEVKIPHAAPSIMAGMQISVVLGLIGAVAAEFIASTHGLGLVIQVSASEMNLGIMFAALFSLAVIGIIGTQILRFVQRRLVFWERSSTADVKTTA